MNFVEEMMNKQVDAGRNRFQVLGSFDPRAQTRHPGTSALGLQCRARVPRGPLALLEFTGALPRACLFSNWRSSTNDDETRAMLASPAFDPHQTVLVAEPIPASATAGTNQPASAVPINTNYESVRIEMDTDVKVPSVLLLNDRYSPKWHVTVDGKPEPLLRCNFIMRGVALQPGKHDVVFQYENPKGLIYTSFAAVAFAIGLCGWVVLSGKPASPRTVPPPANKPRHAAAKAAARA